MAVATARQKLERSQLNPKEIQRELMGEDIDIDSFALYVSSQLRTDVVGRITSADVERTIEGASTLTVVLNDYDRLILRSGLLSSKLDLQVDNLWWRLVKVEKAETGDDLTLTFEDREIAILRTYNKKKVASRQHVTRAEFILNLIREVKEFRIPIVIPQLHVVQDVSTSTDVGTMLQMAEAKSLGISDDEANWLESEGSAASAHHHNEYTNRLTVKGAKIDKSQLRNANIILGVGQDLGVRRKVLVCGIMTAIQESTLRNLSGGDRDSVGLFQQRASWGTYAERHDPVTAARMFFLRAHKADIEDPTRPYWDLCQVVQVSAYPTAYNDWRTEAEKFVTAFGLPGSDNAGSAADANGMRGSDAAGSDYIFYRGTPGNQGKKWTPENSWDCIQRLADEVDWRGFFVSGIFYYLSEDDLFGQVPIAILKEFDAGLDGIGGDYDSNKKAATVTVTARIGRWLAPPGSVVQLQDMGPWDGRWLVYSVSRSLFDSTATITLQKPRPKLPEPQQNEIAVQAQRWDWSQINADPFTGKDKAQFGGVPGTDGTRNAIVKVALAALAEEKKQHYHYNEIRPYPTTLFSDSAHTRGIDCSGFATLVYKEAGCADPNGSSYNGQGYTGTLAQHGTWRLVPKPGDLVFYGDSKLVPKHVAVYIGNNKVIEIGSDQGILEIDMNYRSDLLGAVDYVDGPL